MKRKPARQAIPCLSMFVISGVLLQAGGATASTQASDFASLEESVHSALRFLESEQTVPADGYDPGQWRAQVTVTSLPSHIGVGEPGVPYEEPTAFVAAAVGNVLAEMYFFDRHLSIIPKMVSKAADGLGNYRNGPAYEGPDFYFYPPKRYEDLLVHGPRFMHLNPRWWGFTDDPPDSDTTSSSFLLLNYQKAIQEGVSPLRANYRLSNETISEFEGIRDVNRVPHIYNRAHGDVNTGAFLTWIFDENDPAMPHYYFAKPDQGERIPFNWNDVDCVVNANVIKMLTAAHREDTTGYAESCHYLNDIAVRRQFFTCGQFYPSDYVLPYSMASAIELGAKCLEPSREPLVNAILDSQEKDGSWENHRLVARTDAIQSTAWALNTLLLLGQTEDPRQKAAARKGLDFLLAQSSQDQVGNRYWQGEVFYAAIFIARLPVVWRSTAYTTALVARALDLAHRKWDF